MKKLLTSVALGALILQPFAALAAFNPVTVLRDGLRQSILDNKMEGLDFDLTFTTTEKRYKKADPANSMELRMSMSTDSYPISETAANVQSMFSIPHFSYSTGTAPKKTYENPFGMEVKIAGNETLYLRLTHLHDELKSELVNFGFSLDPIMDRWVKIDLRETLQKYTDEDVSEILADESTDETLKRLQDWYVATEKKYGAPFVVIRRDRTVKDANDDTLQTLHLAPNPRWYPAVQALVMSEYRHANPDATAREIASYQKEMKKGWQEFRKILARVKMKAVVNLTDGTVQSFLLTYTQTKPTYTYNYSYRNGKTITRKTPNGTETVTVKAEFKPRPVSIAIFEEPTDTISGTEAWDLIKTSTSTI